ncbi:MAG: hypothetical protein AB8I08_03265 [Sandaracinaceae bacterium]
MLLERHCWSMLGIALALSGCMSDSDAAVGAVVEPTQCRISGSGTLDNGDAVTGDLSGSATSGSGEWVHTTVGGELVTLSPANVTCRINGVAIGDSNGAALIDGVPGFSYTLLVEDYDNHEPDAVQTLVATYGPSGESDGVLDLAGVASVAVPDALPVTEGSSYGGSATVSFEDARSGDTVTCLYEGPAADDCDDDVDEDMDEGVDEDCDDDVDEGDWCPRHRRRHRNRRGRGHRHRGHGHGHGHDDDDDCPCDADACGVGESYTLTACSDGSAPGDAVDVVAFMVSIDEGHESCGDTAVSIDVSVGHPAAASDDFYVLEVYDETGLVVLDRRGYVSSGELAVESLD